MKHHPALKIMLKLFALLIAAVILFIAGFGVKSLISGSQPATSNRLLTCIDPATNLTSYTVNYTPGKTRYTEWYDENKPLILIQGDPLVQTFKIICGGRYEVSTTRGLVTDFYTILQSDDGTLFFSGNDCYQVRQVISGKPSAEGDQPVRFNCFPIIKLDQSEAVKAAQKNAFERMRDTR